MGRISTGWSDTDRTILHAFVSGKITWDMFDDVIDQAFAMSRDARGRVDLIIDVTPARPPAEGDAYPHLKRLYTERPENVKLHVLVGARQWGGLLFHSLLRIDPRMRSGLIFAETVAEARAMINKERSRPTLH